MIEVVTREVDNPDHAAAAAGDTTIADVDEYDGPKVTFMVEPSGALVILKTPNELWAAYAPSAWLKVRET